MARPQFSQSSRSSDGVPSSTTVDSSSTVSRGTTVPTRCGSGNARPTWTLDESARVVRASGGIPPERNECPAHHLISAWYVASYFRMPALSVEALANVCFDSADNTVISVP